MANEMAELRKKRATLYKSMKDFVITKDAEDDGMSSDDAVSFDEMKVQLDALDKRIERLEEVNSRAPDESDEVKSDDEDEDEKTNKSFNSHGLVRTNVSERSNVVIKHARPRGENPVTRLSRFMLGSAVSKMKGNVRAGQDYIEKHFADREVSKALATTSSELGGATVPYDFRPDRFVDLNYSNSIIRNLGVETVTMPYGTMEYPVLTGSANTYWIGENQDAIISQPSFGDLQLNAKKLVGMVPVSMELLQRSALAVEQIINNNLMKSLGQAEDAQFLTGTPGPGKPNSLLSMCLPAQKHVITLTSLSDINNMLTTMVLDLQANNIDTTGCKWIFHPVFVAYLSTLTDGTGRYFFRDELNQGTLFGYGYALSTKLATNLGAGQDTMVFFVQPNELVLGETLDLVCDSSVEGSYIDGGALSSPWSKYQMVFRVIEAVDFAIKHPQGISIATVTGGHPSFVTSGSAGTTFTAGGTSNITYPQRTV